jgi:mono/diheme cytochrome c family protein
VRVALPVKLPRPVLAGAVAVGVTVVVSACGTGGVSTGGDVAHGKMVFNSASARCSTCHTLAAANATGVIGPNLDNAFSADRAQGFKESSIQQIVADQIRVPLQPVTCPATGSQSKSAELTPCSPGSPVSPTGSQVMPANLAKGKDLTDVAAFVATCAGNQNDPACRGSSAAITATAGKDIFEQAGCGSCHTLKDAGSTGTVGPDLDQLKPPYARIVRQVTNGGAIMPSFKSKLTAAQIHAVAQYVSSVAGK